MSLASSEEIPRPEHPRPDRVREPWQSLNGRWRFAFDGQLRGEHERWYRPEIDHPFGQRIAVPFPWESQLSGLARKDYLGAGWYRREITLPIAWKGKRVWLNFGAIDWHARVWIDGRPVGEHVGGYTPFAFDVTPYLKPEVPAQLVVRAYDVCDATTLLGKQVPRWYNHSSGIWQTVWLEATGPARVARAHVIPDVAGGRARVRLAIQVPSAARYRVQLTAPNDDFAMVGITADLPSGTSELSVDVPIAGPNLWSPESPYLYDLTIELQDSSGAVCDHLNTYFGMREISTGTWDGRDYEYVMLNGEPVYLRGALDQAFTPTGLHSYPSDAAIRADLQLARDFGLNMLRCHIKINDPRYYYWADRLGVLVMYDIPSPDIDTAEMRAHWEATFRAALERDFNHPSIFAWILFNETWGLDQHDTADSHDWLARMYHFAKSLDPSRLVEDNSACRYDHTATDLNTWHYYLNDYHEAHAHVERVVRETYPGSSFNYVGGKYVQGRRPLLNSEYGGISAGAGDVDTSWALKYHTGILRRHDKIGGYVFTELTDVEWEHNGLVNYDRSHKEWGYDAFVEGMGVRDVNGPDVVGLDCPPCQTIAPGTTLRAPLFVSNFGSRPLDGSVVRWQLDFVDRFGAKSTRDEGHVAITPRHFGVVSCGDLAVKLPEEAGLAILALRLIDASGAVINRTYVNVEVFGEDERIERTRRGYAIRFHPGDYTATTWTPGTARPRLQKFEGTGVGSVTYRVALPVEVAAPRIRGLRLIFEAGARAGQAKIDWKERIRRTDYPQTELDRIHPSDVSVRVNGRLIGQIHLPDDPADARGVLSHHANVDPGSYGYLQDLRVPADALEAIRTAASCDRAITVAFSVEPDALNRGGFALYGARVGRYPVDPTLMVEMEG